MSDDDKRSYKGGPIIAVAVVVLPLASYIGGYFGASDFRYDDYDALPIRTFYSEWQVEFFWPALKIEKSYRGDLWAEWPVSENSGYGTHVY